MDDPAKARAAAERLRRQVARTNEMLRARNREISERSAAGESRAALARTYEVSEARIRQIAGPKGKEAPS